MISAVFDACVLYPVLVRDFLLSLANDGLILPFWSEEIRNEWIRSLLRNRPDLKRKNLEQTRRNMDFHFPDSLVQTYESIVPALQLPDMNDRHVLAVAIHTKAEYIVTFNLRDFPKLVLQPHGIEAILPDELVLRLIREVPRLVLQVAKIHRLSLTRPSLSVIEYFAMLEKQGLPKTVAFLREYKSDL